jgi:hypothetical protein
MPYGVPVSAMPRPAGCRPLGVQRAGTTPEPALPERRADAAGGLELLLRLDPLRDDRRAGALLLGPGRRHDVRTRRLTAGTPAPHVELDRVGRDERQQRQRPAVAADVVEHDGPAVVAAGGRRAHQLGRPRACRRRRQLDRDRELLLRALPQLGRARPLRLREAAERLRLDVDEQRRAPVEPGLERTADGGEAALPVDLLEESGAARGAQQRLRQLEAAALRSAREGLVADHVAAGQRDDGLVDRAHQPVRRPVPRCRTAPHFGAYRRRAPISLGLRAEILEFGRPAARRAARGAASAALSWSRRSRRRSGS